MYYILDLIVGFAAPIVYYILYRKGYIADARVFILGCLLGILWELPIFLLSMYDTGIPIIKWITPLPTNAWLFIIAHTFWDGLLLAIGYRLVLHLFPQGFSGQRSGLYALVVYGIVSAFIVELSSILNNAWVYLPDYWWNPVLVSIAGHPITGLILLIWAIAALVAYPIISRYHQTGS